MNITTIEIKNVKGIDHKQFKLELFPNKPNLLVAPNGFGKSSIATAFASMNSKRMDLADKDHHKEDTTLSPELSIKVNGQTLTADADKNEIRDKFDVTVIRSGLVPKATKRNMGRFTQVSASLEIGPILIRKIPRKVEFSYQVKGVRSAFGVNGKILPNISDILKAHELFDVIVGCDLSRLNLKGTQKAIATVIGSINAHSGTAPQIVGWIENNLLADLHVIAPLSELATGLLKLNLASEETESFLIALQIADLYKADRKSFGAAVGWLEYVVEKKYYHGLIQSFCSSNWQWAKLSEDKKHSTLSVTFPKAHQLSNGQRDVLTLVVQMHKALYEGSKKPLILIIDEVFDYLDDANLVAFQYYVTTLIQEYKNRDQTIYPVILTHLDPGIFFDFCFNNHQIRTHYLQATSSGKSRDMLKLIEVREKNDTEQAVKERLDEFWFHFNPASCEIPEGEWPSPLKVAWRKSDDFHEYATSELDRYLRGKKFDALAVCIAVRVSIEHNVYNLLHTDEQKNELIAKHMTKNKLNYAAAHISDIPETYFLLGLIHNANLRKRLFGDPVVRLAVR